MKRAKTKKETLDKLCTQRRVLVKAHKLLNKATNPLCKTRKLLQAGHDLLNEETWVKGILCFNRRADGTHKNFCAVGALQEAGIRGLGDLKVTGYARSYLDLAVPTGSGIVHFNDRVARNVREVKAVFKAAIKEVENRIEKAGNP